MRHLPLPPDAGKHGVAFLLDLRQRPHHPTQRRPKLILEGKVNTFPIPTHFSVRESDKDNFTLGGVGLTPFQMKQAIEMLP